MFRVRSLLLAAILVALLPSPAQSATEIPASFSFGGAGWGHGVGLSQYGARGMALEGKNEAEILQHFYPGTAVAPVRDDMDVRVNLIDQATSVVIRVSGSADSVMQIIAGETKTPNATPVATINFTQSLNLALDGMNVLASIGSKEVTTRLEPQQIFTIRWSGTRFLDGVDAWARVGTTASAPLYRYGQIVVRTVKTATGTALVVNNDVRIHDEYLRGIAEMPSSWPVAALKAQVIAARSYALSRYGTGKLTTACGCHMYSSTKDQRFVGWAKEAEANWGARWAGAVAETAADPLNGVAVIADGKPITAYFFSSSGGRTQDVAEVWGSRIRWLTSVPDPWSLDPSINPTYASWTRSVTQGVMAKAFGLPNVVEVTFPLRTAGGGIRSAVGTSSTGQSVTLTGEVFRSRTQLPSTYLMRALGRIDGESASAMAVNVNRVTRPSGNTVVLSDDGERDITSALASIGLSAELNQPHFLVSDGVLSKTTLDEMKRRKVTSATIVGDQRALPKGVVTALNAAGIKSKRISTAVALTSVKRIGDPVAISVLDPEAAISVAAFAARERRPLVLIGVNGLTDATRAQLKMYEGSTLTLHGRRISIPRLLLEEISASMTIDDRRGGDGDRVLADVAAKWDAQGSRVLVVGDAVGAMAASTLQQPMLIARPGEELPEASREWIQLRPRLVQITVIGTRLGSDVLQALRAIN
jgi:stage II sporulation protein D